jgi:acetyltransferase-like isoleucine patch superfamily enzyme
MSAIEERVKKNQKLKQLLHRMLMHPVKTRPRLWLRMLQPFYLERGKRSVIYRSVRKDLVPFRRFSLGCFSVVEDFSVLNNAVGDVLIGDFSRIGIGNTVIGPVSIGNHVCIGQNVVLSGLNHNYHEIDRDISGQGVSVAQITVEDNVWIGAHSVILSGVTIGKHSVVGAASVVSKDIPPYSVCVGNPARVIKQYNFEKKEWVKVTK